MQVKDIMTHEIELVHPDTALSDAAEKMRAADTGALPVGTDGKLVGILTDRDIAVRGVPGQNGSGEARVRDAMTENPRTLQPDQDTAEAAQLMGALKVRRLPAVDDDEKLVGMVSLADIARSEGPDRVGETVKQISKPGGPGA